MILQEKDLTEISIKFGEKYINKVFHSKDAVDISMAVNGVSHGFFSGVRYAEGKYDRFFFPRKKPINTESLQNLSIKATKYYLKKKKFNKLPSEDQILLASTFAYGFREGVKHRESDL